MIESRVARISTILEPAAAAGTTTAFTGLVSTALATCGGGLFGGRWGLFGGQAGVTATVIQVLSVQETPAFAKARGALFRVALAVAIRVRAGPGAFHYHAAPFLRETCRCGLAEAAVLRKIFAAIRWGYFWMHIHGVCQE